MRDFIHVCDLASAHVQTLDFIFKTNENFHVFNVGLGKPISVQQIVDCFINVNKIQLDVIIKEKRQGDLSVSYCDNSKILEKINWKPKYTFEDACKHTWKYYINYFI